MRIIYHAFHIAENSYLVWTALLSTIVFSKTTAT